ncbi:hypothetical protein CEUSTIGMA_g341.t1 [Chlamydomonas eustigma]|uniref:R3H-associated N-terminal domain-containing protein n=1 Tax=Chlamydomonas eustigma TaxID=1157962 RepID=A0A250WQA4_9CHLO|nr:hypothetical protein CEUSTIGMA_g341.t1 [Chlamydomonas eustigma]|eukprot:GAX72886.1 hypothetical protein CEUSTIGMA_g341.t1 [Chlamydomonas eustigma]
MSSHAPYIMPDGGRMGDVLKSERRKNSKKAEKTPGKQEQANLVTLWTARAKAEAERGHNISAQELAELRALESVGVRRRRRWFNEKQLRDAAGPLSASDMAALFNPVPFGAIHESPLQQIREDPGMAAVWDSFRNIDEDKEARVLQRWEEYNKEAARDTSTSSRVSTPAGIALQNWARVSKASRAALRKANVHSVLSLETQVLELFEQDDLTSPVTLSVEDAFGRMLVHGLAQFHGLASISNKSADCSVSVHLRDKNPLHSKQTDGSEITCTDILMALAEHGRLGLTHTRLGGFVRKNVHGLSSEAASESEWVIL